MKLPAELETPQRRDRCAANRVAHAPRGGDEAADWAAGGRDAGLLLKGPKLTKATVDIGAKLRPAPNSGRPSPRLIRRFGSPGTIGQASTGHPRRTQRHGTRIPRNQHAPAQSRRLRRKMQVIGVIVIAALLALAEELLRDPGASLGDRVVDVIVILAVTTAVATALTAWVDFRQREHAQKK